MWKENLYQPVEILLRAHDDFPIGEHQHSFFEMTYILEGEGEFRAQGWNGETTHQLYRAHHLFLTPPNTPHVFTIRTHSRYLFVRFTPAHVADYLSRQIEECLEAQSRFCIELPASDADTMLRLAEMTASEATDKNRLSELLLPHYADSMILICARNLSASVPEPEKIHHDKAQYMLQYIQHHIHQPELLKLDALADKFHLSPTYAGRFFKRNFGEDFTQYISKIRLRKVEHLLTHTQLSLKEIAAQTGYTDACYLHKLFVRHHGITPLQFRKNSLREQ